MRYGMMDNYQGFGLFGIGWVFDLLLWALIIAGIIYLIRRISDDNRTKEKTPLDILKERYARGELTKQEYEEKRKDLMN